MERRIRGLRAYSGDDEDTSVTGNHGIVAMPGSTVVLRPDSEAPLSERTRAWRKTAVRVVGALMGLATVIKAIWEATR